MKAFELFEDNDLATRVLIWLIGKGLPEKDARKYLTYVSVEELGKEMDVEREKQETIARDLENAMRKTRQLSKLKRDNPDYVTYNLIDDKTKSVMIGGKEVGTLTKDGNKWSSTIYYNNNNKYEVTPNSIMKVQDEIDVIAFRIK